MCTAITLQSNQGENFFGRTMDFSYPIEPGLYVIPRNYEWSSLITKEKNINHITLSVLVIENEGMLGFFDGVNEQGFAAAVLYFEAFDAKLSFNIRSDFNYKLEILSNDLIFPLYLRTLRLLRVLDLM